MAINLYDPAANNKALEQISSAVADIIQPYKKQQLALRGAMTADPSLAQKLANLEALNPGTIDAFAGEGAGNYFRSMGASPETQAEIAARPALGEALKDKDTLAYTASKEAVGAGPGAVKQDKFKGELADAGFEVLEDGTIRRASGIKSATKTTEGKLAQDKQLLRRQQDIEGALAIPDMRNEWVKAVTGQQSKLTFRQVSALMDDPIQKSLLLPYLEKMRTDRYMKGLESAELRAQMTQGKTLDNLYLRRALELKGTRGKSTTGAYLKLIGAPDRLVEEAGGYTEEQLQQAQDEFDLIHDQTEIKTTAGASKQNFEIIKSYGNLPEEAKQAAIHQMNINARNGLLPYFYTTDSDGNIAVFDMTSGQQVQDATTTYVKPRTPKSKPNLPPKPTTSTSAGGGSAGVTVKGKQSVAAPTTPQAKGETPGDTAFDRQFSDGVRRSWKAAPQYTMEEVRKFASFQTLTKTEQDYILTNTKDFDPKKLIP